MIERDVNMAETSHGQDGTMPDLSGCSQAVTDSGAVFLGLKSCRSVRCSFSATPTCPSNLGLWPWTTSSWQLCDKMYVVDSWVQMGEQLAAVSCLSPSVCPKTGYQKLHPKPRGRLIEIHKTSTTLQ